MKICVLLFAVGFGISLSSAVNQALECRIPEDSSSLNNSIRVNLTQEEKERLAVEGRCFLGCAIRVYFIDEDQPEVIIKSNVYWPYINVSGLDCGVSAHIHECTRGCIRHILTPPEFFAVDNCSTSCVNSCTESQGCDPLTSDCHPWIRKQCEIRCDGDIHEEYDECVRGCRIRIDNPTVFEGIPPPSPTGPPRLIPDHSNGRAGQYTVDLSDAIPEGGSGFVEPDIVYDTVTFLFKFEEVYSHNVSYKWMANLDHLDLSQYACQELIVSFAVSKLTGLSEFSPPTRVIIYEGQNVLRIRNPNSTYPGSQYEGIVEVFHNGEWGTICNRNWNYHTAFVACRTVGFNSAVRAVLDATYFGGGVGQVQLDNVQCMGSEAALWDCSRSSWLDVDASCQNHLRDAAVICSDDLALRLVGTGSSISQGRVEVSHSGQWGTICDNYWDNRDANVVCRQLGFSRGAVHAYSNAHFGSGTGQIWMDNVQCTGNETSLEDCYFRGWGIHNCSHYEDAGVVCAPDNITGDYYPVRLVVNERNSNNTPSLSYGHVEIFINGSWGTVCNDSWGIEDAQVVCRQLGFEGALSALPRSAFDQTDRNLSIYLDDVHCLGDEPALSYCVHNGIGVHNCGHYEDASVICQSMPLIQGPPYTAQSDHDRPPNNQATALVSATSLLFFVAYSLTLVATFS